MNLDLKPPSQKKCIIVITPNKRISYKNQFNKKIWLEKKKLEKQKLLPAQKPTKNIC